jgi:hypothetical protein
MDALELMTLADNSVCVVPNIAFTLDRNREIRHSVEMPSNQLMYPNASFPNKQHAFIIKAISVCKDIFTTEAFGLPYM